MDCPIPRFPRGTLVRFNAYGELLNEAHLWNLMDIAIAYDNPEATFALWTKRIALAGPIVKPPNMITIYSQPLIDGPTYVPPGFDGTYVVHPDGSPCGDRCIECRACYGGSKAPFVIHQRLH